MKCPYCKGNMQQELISYKTIFRGEEITLEEVPTWVCEQCESTIVEDEVIEAIQDMLSGLEGGIGDEEAPEEIELHEI